MKTDPRDRGDVKPPRDFGMFVAGYELVSGVVPIALGAWASDWSSLGDTAFAAGLIGAMAFGMTMIMPVALGAARRWIRWNRGAGLALLALHALGWPVVLAHPFGFLPSRPGIEPGPGAGDWLAIAMMAAIGLPAAAMLTRALRHTYWHVDAPRDHWTD